MTLIAIAGAGAWGTALATVARRAGHDVLLWSFEADVADAINADHVNDAYLPGVALDPAIRATADLAALDGADALLLVTPAQHVRRSAGELARHIGPDMPIVVCAKGIEQKTGALMSEVLAETLPGNPLAVLSGPTFAAEVARDLPTAVTAAAADPALANALAMMIGTRRFRPYVSDDITGAEIGGAVKNVLAIACGITSGRGLGDNARAALITRGLAEVTRLALAKGGRAETMMGLCGIGDLTLTCTDMQSRNYSLGVAIGKGETLAGIMAARRSVAEGVFTAPSVMALAGRLGLDMPICGAVDAVLHRGVALDAAIEDLLSRPLQKE